MPVDYPALRRPRLTAGVGAKSATMIWMMTAMVSMAIGLPWGLSVIPFAAIIHFVLSWVFSKDPHIMALYTVHEVIPNDLHEGQPQHGDIHASRPSGFAKDLPMA